MISLMLLIVVRMISEFTSIDVPSSGLDTLKVLVVLAVFSISVILRLKRTQILVSFLKPNSLIGNLQGSSVGYLANLLLPFRLGELARGYFLSRYFGISLGFTIGVIALDRGLDLVMIFILLIGHYGINSTKSIGIFTNSELTVIATGTIVFIIFVGAIFRARILLFTIQKISGFFNEKIQSRLRNSFWGLILIFQKILQNRRLLRQYILAVILSWIFTYSTVVLLVFSAQDVIDLNLNIVGYIPFVSFVILNGNDYFSDYTLSLERLSKLISPSEAAENFLEVFSSLSWLLLTFPYLIMGITSMFLVLANKDYVSRYKLTEDSVSQKSNKLTAPSNFLDSFFAKEKLIESIHNRSVTQNFKVLEYFKGGSDAVTMLVQKSSIKLVQKVSGPQGFKQLKAQQEWLQNMKSDSIVKVLDSRSSGDDFELDLEYVNPSISLFDYIHTNSLDSSKKVILRALEILEEDVYGGGYNFKEVSGELKDYLHSCFHERVATVAKKSPEFAKFIDTRSSIKINGELYFDLRSIFEKIQASKRCLQVLTWMNSTEKCHGDFTVDNILVSSKTGLPILIDPSDDNTLKGPLIDISRLMQSLLGGYEFLNRDILQVDLELTRDPIHIGYHDMTSHKYDELSKWLFEDVLPNKLTENELKAVKFHVGVFYARMLTHRFLVDEKSMFKYVAVAIRYLNEFYEDVTNGHE